METWGGYRRGDAHTVVAVNVSPIAVRLLADAIQTRLALYRDSPTRRLLDVRGARQAVRLDGLTHGDSPAEPQALTLVISLKPTGPS